MGRLLAKSMTVRLGKPIIVENRPGATTSLGTAYVAKSPPDGYTLLLAAPSSLAIIPQLQPVGYDPDRDFEKISIFGQGSFLFGVSAKVPATSLASFYSLAARSPRGFSYASVGSGGISHIMMELASRAMNVQMTHVPYNGSAGGMGGLLSGDVEAYLGTSGELSAYIGSDRVKVLAVSSPARQLSYPDLPTIAETIPGFSVMSWNALVAPRGTPAPIIDRLVALVKEIARDPEVRQRLLTVGIEPVGSEPAELIATIQSDREKFLAALKAAQMVR